MKAKTDIYGVQGHSFCNQTFYVSAKFKEQKYLDFEVREFFAFLTSTALDRVIEIFGLETFLDVFFM